MGLLDGLRRFFGNSKFYTCKDCGYKMPKTEIVISGWDSQQGVRHVHCPKCGKAIKYT